VRERPARVTLVFSPLFVQPATSAAPAAAPIAYQYFAIPLLRVADADQFAESCTAGRRKRDIRARAVINGGDSRGGVVSTVWPSEFAAADFQSRAVLALNREIIFPAEIERQTRASHRDAGTVVRSSRLCPSRPRLSRSHTSIAQFRIQRRKPRPVPRKAEWRTKRTRHRACPVVHNRRRRRRCQVHRQPVELAGADRAAPSVFSFHGEIIFPPVRQM